MTVLVWDGKTLAADKQMQSGSTKQSTTKIFRWRDQLLGLTGNLSVGMEMLNWYAAGQIAKDFPDSNRKLDEGCSLIAIHPDGKVWKYESSPEPFAVEGPYCAFGSGDQGALVAMACGKTAKEAVRLASLFDSGCGLGIDTLDLKC